ncbi:hypothetical protein L6452_29073 [Arctium lappa]|uniref:Uncharacterized protein n=1 Tax=Arctium lappa TaxID=4217 RepID=A0ACB8ZFY5_ARCLA|nr:hypothetical protein L6452_29073 [Arctium lappa]
MTIICFLSLSPCLDLFLDRNERPPIDEIIEQLEIALQDQLSHDFKMEMKLKSNGEVEENDKSSVHLGYTSKAESKGPNDDPKNNSIENIMKDFNLNSSEKISEEEFIRGFANWINATQK